MLTFRIIFRNIDTKNQNILVNENLCLKDSVILVPELLFINCAYLFAVHLVSIYKRNNTDKKLKYLRIQ